MLASKTAAREFVDSAFKPKPLFGASRLSLLKGKGRVRIPPHNHLASETPHLNPLPFTKEERRNNAKHMRDLSKLNAAR
jgi:hypothetical protein